VKIIRKKKLIGNDSDTLLTNAVIGDVQKMRFPFIETIITTHQILLKLVLKNLIQKKKKIPNQSESTP